MQSLNARIADRIKRGKEEATRLSPDGKPTEEEIFRATSHTAINTGSLPVDTGGETITPPMDDEEDDGTDKEAGWSSNVDPKSGKPNKGVKP